MFATQYDEMVEAALSWMALLALVEAIGTASTGEVETERRRKRRVTDSAAAEKDEKDTMMMRSLVLN